MKTIIHDERELIEIGKIVLEKIEKQKNDHAGVVALYGDLGSGKTTFTKELAKLLNIKEKITSPTFVILKNFNIPENSQKTSFKKMTHIDTYRLDLPEELLRLGFEDLLKEKENLIIIEWPEIIEEVLPQNRLNIRFKFIDHTKREIEIDNE